MKTFYLTTAIPYINAKPHIGHALEYVIADAIHRYHETLGTDTYFVSGADENSLKNVQAAEKEGLEPPVFLDKYAQVFQEFYDLLEADLDVFRRATDQEKHWPGVQDLWRKVEAKGDLYKKSYKGLYCIGCESFKTETELIEGKCPDHNKEPEIVEEENYFFKLSNYQEKLINLIESDQFLITPAKRKNEMLSFIKSGLEDFSVSRSNERARGIGVPVPGDETQKMYVWFDALNIYMTGIGFGYDQALWEKYWPANLHVIGKDIIRFHAVYWPAMLLSADVPLPTQLLVHGHISSQGRKMSKSLGNVIDPYQVIESYGVEATRYYLLSQIPTLDDGDFTIEQFENIFTAHLSNGLGNLVSRIAALCSKAQFKPQTSEQLSFSPAVNQAFSDYQLNTALEFIWAEIRQTDLIIDERQPWKQGDVELAETLEILVERIRQIATDLRPFMPVTATKITDHFNQENISKIEPLFPRLETK